jgi:asparagine synthase (glutamine-hydrolysing)
MCGVLARLLNGECESTRECFENQLNKLNHRGPEGSNIVQVTPKLTFGFTRLAINGLTSSGMQPYANDGITWMCNGEIYNHKQVENLLDITNTRSDCECIGRLYMLHRDDLKRFSRALDGVFAIVLHDAERNRLIVTRDPYGVRPLFASSHKSGTSKMVEISSEIKAFCSGYDEIVPIMPGSIRSYDSSSLLLIDDIQYHAIPWIVHPNFTRNAPDAYTSAWHAINFALNEAVKKRLLSDRPIAALLSGGLDSSLVASLLQKHSKMPIKTFAIGFEGSSDIHFARIVSEWIKSDHTEIIMTPDEFFDAIPEVIRAIESYDTTTVRASVGNYLVAKKIRDLSDCKVVFNGDGSDELFGGYLYFRNAPSDEAFHAETERLLKDLHYFDVLRSDRTISANGLEARTPFLDKQFVSVVRSIDPHLLRPVMGQTVEKEILRRAFDDGVTLPSSVLWRRKEAFSDGVSSPEKAWFSEIKERVDALIQSRQVPSNVPHPEHLCITTNEEYYYWFCFTSTYGYNARTVVPYRWMPKWCPGATDPSARTLEVYEQCHTESDARLPVRK